MSVSKKADIVVGAKDKASKKFKGIKKGLGEIGKAAIALNQGMELLSKATDAFVAVFDIGQLGAETEKMEFAFGKMADSVGASTDAIISKVERLTNNTISEFEIMRNASRLAALGLPIDKIGEFAEIARAAAAAMGESTQFMFDSIVTGTARQSKLILDNLGIIISETKVYAEETKRLGRELTDAEKKQAFLNAVLREGKKSVDAIGDTSGLAQDSFEQFGAATDNLKREIGKLVVGPMTAIVGGLASMATNLAENLKGFKSLTERIRDGEEVWDDYATTLKATDKTLGEVLDEILAAETAVIDSTNAVDDSLNSTQAMDDLLKEFANSYGQVTAEATATADSIDDVTLKTKKQGEEIIKTTAITSQQAFEFFEAEVARFGALEQLRQDIATQNKKRAQEEKERIEDRLDLIMTTETEIADFLIIEEAKKKIASRKFTDAQVKEFINAERAKQQAFQDTADIIIVGMESVANSLHDIIEGARLNFQDVFMAMARDFAHFFIDEVTRRLRNAVLLWAAQLGLKLLGVPFPVPGGGGGPVGDFPTPGGPISARVGGGFGTGGSNIVINIQGNIIGEDEWVKNRMIPILEEAINNRETTIDVELI